MNWALEQRSEGFQGARCQVIYKAWGMARCPGGRLAPIGRQQRKAWQRCWVQKEHISIEELKSPPWRRRAGWGWGSWQVTWSLVDIYWQDCGKPPDKERERSDIIRFAIFKDHSVCCVERLSKDVHEEAHTMGKGASQVWVWPRCKATLHSCLIRIFWRHQSRHLFKKAVCCGNTGLRC